MALLVVHNLEVKFFTRAGIVNAVNTISFTVEEEEIIGIAGESGSGKSVTCYAILGLLPSPPAQTCGEVTFNGQSLLGVSEKTVRRIRGRHVSMIFQDPMTSLNPYLSIGSQLIEPVMVHKSLSKAEAKKKAAAALGEVGMYNPEAMLKKYPHEFSGGMRQRVMIAMAMINEPKLLIADEPTTALDVTIQAQILDLIQNLQKKHGTSVLFITHDLGVLSALADRVIVMYAGEILEHSSTAALFSHPAHPYTRALIDSIPSSHQPGEKLYVIEGTVPDLTKKRVGCSFASRCQYVQPLCRTGVLTLCAIGDEQYSKCLLMQKGTVKPGEFPLS